MCVSELHQVGRTRAILAQVVLGVHVRQEKNLCKFEKYNGLLQDLSTRTRRWPWPWPCRCIQ